MATPGTALSVVTTVYRSERFLPAFIEQTVAAIVSAGMADYEIVFVNDGSPDASREYLLEARASDPLIKLVALSRNCWPTQSRAGRPRPQPRRTGISDRL